uniref:FAD-binding protein n=1 Tax=Archaeoglobus fulgidus TaxID=2234 RepID=A0A7C3ZF15_ARCFL
MEKQDNGVINMISERKLRILKKAGEALIPPEGNLPEYSVEVDEKIEKIFRKMPPHIRFTLNISLILLEIFPLIRIFKLKKPAFFTSLDIGERYELLQRLRESKFFIFRTLFLLIKTFAVVLYASKKEVEKVVGYSVNTGIKKKVFSPNLVRENIIEGHNIIKKEGHHVVRIRCDVLVIGSGAGGAVVAKELAERGFDVAVIEEGFMFECDKLESDLLTVTSELYREAGMTFTASLNQPTILVPTGIALGGTTVINEGTCFRIPDDVLERWIVNFNLEGVEPKEMEKYFKKVERTLNVHPASVNLMSKAAMKVAYGAEKLGYSYFPLYKNISGCEGLGRCELCCPIDAKKAMHVSYIPLATQNGARFYTGFRAKWIEFKGKRITKVGGEIISRDGELLGRFVAEFKILVIAAGAIHTPYLLLKNGVANSSGMVGKNLRIHPALGVMGIFDETMNGWEGIRQSLVVNEFSHEGIMLEVTFAPLPIAMAGNWVIGKELSKLFLNYKQASMVGVMIGDDSSRGRVLAFPDFLPLLGKTPILQYRFGEKDVQKAVKGLIETCKIYFAAGAQRVVTPLLNFPVVKTDDLNKLEKIGRLHPNMLIWSAYHPQGTCRMSAEPYNGVVNSYCRSHDFENMYIADASIFPSCVRVNPMISIMAFATRTAEYISEVNNAV